MKKFMFLFMGAILLSTLSHAQNHTPFDSHANDKVYVYCEIVRAAKLFSSKINIEVDFGQARDIFDRGDMLRDENGKKIVFNSIVDALNYMGLKGWNLAQVYVITDDSSSESHYLLRKELDPGELQKVNEIEIPADIQ